MLGIAFKSLALRGIAVSIGQRFDVVAGGIQERRRPALRRHGRIPQRALQTCCFSKSCDQARTLIVNRDHVRGSLRRDSTNPGYNRCVSVIDADGTCTLIWTSPAPTTPRNRQWLAVRRSSLLRYWRADWLPKKPVQPEQQDSRDQIPCPTERSPPLGMAGDARWSLAVVGVLRHNIGRGLQEIDPGANIA